MTERTQRVIKRRSERHRKSLAGAAARFSHRFFENQKADYDNLICGCGGIGSFMTERIQRVIKRRSERRRGQNR